jgi:hypothetical protein
MEWEIKKIIFSDGAPEIGKSDMRYFNLSASSPPTVIFTTLHSMTQCSKGLSCHSAKTGEHHSFKKIQ